MGLIVFRGLDIHNVRAIAVALGVFFVGVSVGGLKSSSTPATTPQLTGNFQRHARGSLNAFEKKSAETNAPVSPSALPTTTIPTPAQTEAPLATLPPPAANAPLLDGRALQTPAPAQSAIGGGAKTSPIRTSRPPATPKSTRPVSINRAGPEELDSLSKVGEKIAARIIQERTLHGPYRSAEDLMNRVSGIGPRIIEENKGRLRFD